MPRRKRPSDGTRPRDQRRSGRVSPGPRARILLVEDHAPDATLALRALRGAGLAFEAKVVGSCRAFDDALATHAYDLVISDHRLPDGTARDVLRLIQERGLDLPCIIFTGTLPDDAAAGLAAAGATDYVLKNAPARLCLAVQHALERRAERNVAALRLEESEERFRRAFDEAPLGMALVTPDLRYIHVNAALCDMLGYSREQLQPLGVIGVSHPADAAAELLRAAQAFRGDQPAYHLEKRCLDSAGHTVWVRVIMRVMRNALGEVRYGLRMVENISERKRIEEERAAFPRRLIDLQESERRALARELHDEAGQLLTGLQFMLENGEPHPGDMLLLVRDLQHRLRGISANLRPPLLDELGLAPALREHCARLREQTGLQVELWLEGLGPRLDREIETAAFRVIQEGLTNVARHALVNAAAVRVREDAAALHIEVRDQGPGFDPAAAPAGDSSGLSGMCERVRLAGGHCAIESMPGAGTRITVDLPVRPAA